MILDSDVYVILNSQAQTIASYAMSGYRYQHCVYYSISAQRQR